MGGVEQDAQIRAAQEGIDILIATPGRMFDLISQKVIDTRQVKTLILDEADQMLAKGFLEDIQCIKRLLKQRHQTLFFSATINKNIKKLAYSLVSSHLRSGYRYHQTIRFQKMCLTMYWLWKWMIKDFFLRRFIHEHPDSKILVFVRTAVRAERVAKALERANLYGLTIYGQKEQDQRLEALTQFKSGKEKILIATDVSARGVDIPNVDYVINYDLPDREEIYVHRVGRTGRGRSKGIAVSFCSSEEKELLNNIQAFINKPIETIKMEKQDYSFTTDVLDTGKDIREMIQANEAWEKKKRKKKGKNR